MPAMAGNIRCMNMKEERRDSVHNIALKVQNSRASNRRTPQMGGFFGISGTWKNQRERDHARI